MNTSAYKNTSLFAATCLMSVALFCLSCNRDNPLVLPSDIELSERQVEIGSDGRYYSVTMKVTGDSYSLKDLHATTDADWIRLEADTVSRDGRLTFYVSPNTDARSRNGIINIKLPISGSDITIHQFCEAEDGSNALNGDALSRKARVGYGYNMLIDYMDPASVTEPILDYERLVQAEQSWGTIIAQEGRAQQSLSYHSSYSIEEMSSWMSKQTTTEVNFLFINKSVNKFKSTSEFDLSQQTFGYSSLSKVIATRYIDEGKIESILRQGVNIFTNDFRELYKRVNSQPDAENVRQLVCRFGTHLVTYADLGGRLDYSVNFRSDETSRESVEKYLKYKNGNLRDSKESNDASHAIISNGGLHFDIYGGTEAAIKALESSASTKDRYGQIDQSLLGEWLNSIKATDPESVSLVRCMLQPIWQLFTNQEARVQIINHILELSYSEGGEVSKRLQELGLDNFFQVEVTDEMQKFGTSANSTLAKVIYFEGLPKVEICNEYVPELRGDRRVNIFYPIFRNQTNIRRGIFPGDGENAPAEVTFDNDGGCYVRQLEGYNPGDRLTTLFYIDGAFYPNSISLNIPKYSMVVKDETLELPLEDIRYPIVKIGPGYWTRENIRERLFFGEPAVPDDPYCSDYLYYEDIIDGMLYTNVSFGSNFPQEFENIFDTKTDVTGKRTCWYLPDESNICILQKYIGQNCKALFSGQQSGFEAQFAGYYGRFDEMNGGNVRFSDGREDIRYRNQYCFIVAKNGDKSQALILSKDYTIRRSPVNMMFTNWYPVRAFRLPSYRHPNLK